MIKQDMSNDTTLSIPFPSLFVTLWDAPGSDRGFFRCGNTEIHPVGTDLGGRVTLLGANAVPGLGATLTIHVEGGSHWAGRGMRATHGAQVMTWLVQRYDAYTWRYVRLAVAPLARNADERSATTAAHVANTIRTMEVPS